MRLIDQNLRLIQFNLQVKDTCTLKPKEVAESVVRMHANGVVLNVGGIYAWYNSEVPFHHVNEYLPKGRDLLREIMDACHEKGIAVIGRYDFSKTDDTAYLQHPEWFVQTADGEPVSYGSKRMGNWSLLMSTCLNSGYRNEEFAVPVFEESLRELPMDGIFLNAPHMERCWCDNCKRKYRSMYQKELPVSSEDWEPTWSSNCVRDNVAVLNRAIKKIDPEMPLILYYGTYEKEGMRLAENLDERYLTADMICTEAQNILSAGKSNLADRFKPTINMKLGQLQGHPKPFGIIHSCPGMDWRHTGMPAAEYEYWMSQIVPAGGQIWHSLTGCDAAITDRRLIRVVEKINAKCESAASVMKDAQTVRSVLLLWDARACAIGYTQALMESHIPFDLMDIWHMDAVRMKSYPIVIIPDQYPLTDENFAILREYTQAGGHIFAQFTALPNAKEEMCTEICEFFGFRSGAVSGKNTQAAYGVLEDMTYGTGLEETRYIPIRRNVLYARPAEGTRTIMTWIPPFAPADGVGAPPERASMPVTHTDIPMLLTAERGKGRIITCLFELAWLIRKIGLEDQKLIFENCMRSLGAQKEGFSGEKLPDSVYSYPYETKNSSLIHLVNTEGDRPVRTIHPWYQLSFEIRTDREIRSVTSELEHTNVFWKKEGRILTISLEKLEVWDLIRVEYQS